ncbi:Proteasome maturation factor Ump1 [Babesia duncani]|uniref:Proteasome maturation factor Ump1 n=1 Tax=Babesia duncani TaxID=323732 RepID=A0AAD9UPC0_9APIC|nr:Proteasome maturation factor Ump1 [Babesia duncani]
MADNSVLQEFKINLDDFPKNSLDTDDGVQTAYGDVVKSHPLENFEYKTLLENIRQKDLRLRRAFGLQEVFKSQTECNMCSKSTRLPGIKSSCLSLEILMDRLDTISPIEYMNTVKPTNEFGVGGIHGLMENKFNI